MQRPPLVISIQSQVVMGQVGNSAAAFPMQAAGLEVAQIPTVLLSNTPFYPTLRGGSLPEEFFADLLRGAEERGLTERAAYILTGYVSSPAIAEMTADFVARARAVNPRLTYICDPVMGDTKPGLYVPETIARVICDRLLPQADIATPNPFEVSYLSGVTMTHPEDILEAARKMRLRPEARLIATGCRLAGTPEGMIETVVHGPEGTSRHPVTLQPAHVSGTGDLFAALVTVGLARGLALAHAVDHAQVQMSRSIARSIALGLPEVALDDPAFRRDLLSFGMPAALV
ncbi:pyridoxal kinase [Paenirhodobacter enshiensis]|uniref:pyridoxal kinase n=1 Tax=Paenirhodobacter enshiensis TaxID=1105367 RepID=UPI0035AD8AB3